MTINVFQLLSAKQAEVSAEVQRVEALRDYWVARARVESILAGGSNFLDVE